MGWLHRKDLELHTPLWDCPEGAYPSRGAGQPQLLTPDTGVEQLGFWPSSAGQGRGWSHRLRVLVGSLESLAIGPGGQVG